MKQKTLCINLGYGGGCVYYANNLIKYLTVRKEVWIYGTVTSPMRMGQETLCCRRAAKYALADIVRIAVVCT